MATLILRSAGAAIGTALGGPLGGFLGGAVGAIGGAVVDSLLIRALTPRHTSPQLSTLPITNAAESVVLHKLWGRMRLGGNVIWCTQFNTYTTRTSTGSGKGSLLSGPTTKVTHYTLSFAVAFCEGDGFVSLGRVWGDGNLLDMSKYTHTFYNGAEDQQPDSLIESIEGAGNVPAYRGTCYLVFDAMVLDDFGNRMPQITAELIRRSPYADADDLNVTLKAVCLLPGAGEFVLGTLEYQSTDGFGNWFPENQHQKTGLPDFYGSMDELAAALPGRQAVSLVVTWFGTDLRAGSCQITPKVETATKTVKPADWTVAGFTRATAPLVSQIAPATLDPTGIVDTPASSGTAPAFGGTPSDATVTQAIQYMNGQGIRVMFYPFILMDIPAGNGLPDPHGGTEQAAFPWRGRVTCDPGPGQAGTVDKTAAAGAQVAAFFAQYGVMVLHYASLCVAAGGVDCFVIGSELVGLTQVRSSPGDGTYPAVQALKTLAAQVKAIVGPGTKVTYAADWSEYHSHRPADGSNDVIFNMDPLWSDPNIDVIGIDNYLPLSDWRDGVPNIDADPVNGPTDIHDKTYLAGNVEGGRGGPAQRGECQPGVRVASPGARRLAGTGCGGAHAGRDRGPGSRTTDTRALGGTASEAVGRDHRDRAVAGAASAGGARCRRRRAAARPRRPGSPMIPLPSGTKVWLATGHTDMRKGIGGLSLLVQEVLGRDPFCGHLFVFRGRRSDLIKIVWHDGQGGCLFMKRLDRGRFTWPSASDGAVPITPAQLAYLTEGIDWRNPQQTWRPTQAG